MMIQVNAPFHVNEGLQALIDEKVNKLTHYFERIESVEIFFRGEDNQSTPVANTAEIKVLVPGQTLYADESSESYEKSLAAAADKMRKQLIKYKELLTPHL